MLLKDVESPLQIKKAIADGDEELRQNIKDLLDEAEEKFFASDAPLGDDPFEFESADDFFSNYIENSQSFTDEVIEQSKYTEYNLSAIPRSYVEANCKYLASLADRGAYRGRLSFGNFTISEHSRRYSYFNHSVEADRYVRFDAHRFAAEELQEYGNYLPEGMVEVFWGNMADRVGRDFKEKGGWQEGTRYFGDNHGYLSGDTYFITASDEDFAEFCRDTLGDYLNDAAKKNPDELLRIFYNVLSKITPVNVSLGLQVGAENTWDIPRLEKTIEQLIEERKLTKKEVLDYAINALVSEEEEDRKRALRSFEYKIFSLTYPDEAFEDFISEISEYLYEEQVKTLNSLIEKNVIDKNEMLKKAEAFFSEESVYEKKIIRDELLEEIEEYLAAMGTGSTEEARSPLVTVDRADLKQMGIEKGVFWEEAPWKLMKLRASELPEEGRIMRHCVGDKGMGYARAVHRGEIEIWSLRDRNNKPRFTLEVEADIHRHQPDEADLELTGKAASRRAKAVKQLKGKANRTPGFAERSSGSIALDDEVTVWKWLLKKLHIKPDEVLDFGACRVKPKPATEAIAGSYQSLLSFDQPYQPSLPVINGYVLEAAALLSGARRKVPKKYTAGLGKSKAAKRKAEIRKRAEEPHTDPKSYRPFKTDVDKRTGKPIETKESQYTKEYRKKFGAATEIEAKAKGSEKLTKALKNKSEDSGIPVRILRQVYNRGLAAWRTGHRPGASQHAWGMARVNSFILKGKTWKTADADLAKKARAAKKVKASVDEVVALLSEEG